jgi:hypothetical protein
VRARLLAFVSALATALLVGARSWAEPARPLPLSAYPRPPADNGTGIHWAPTIFAQPPEMVERLLQEVVAMDMRWLKLMQGDEPKLEHEYLLRRLRELGIMPVLRIYLPCNQQYQHLRAIAAAGTAAGVYYYELYNEPNLSGPAGGWCHGEPISVPQMVSLWVDAAQQVIEAGGYPGLPALAPGGDYEDTRFLRAFLQELRRRGQMNLLYRAWLPLHNYFLNHPFNYPYDDVNLRSTPLTEAEIAERGLSPELAAEINHYRKIARRPREEGGFYVGSTVYEDSNGFYKFMAYARILEEECGFVIPMITTEGGAILGTREDPRYPPVDEKDLVERTLQAFSYMSSEAPPYYFAFMPWLLANRAGNSLNSAWEGAAWIKEDGTTLPVVAALKARAKRQVAEMVAQQPLTASHELRLPTSEPDEVELELVGLEAIKAKIASDYPWIEPPGLLATQEGKLRLRLTRLTNGAATAWIAPDVGARIVLLRNGSTQLLPLPSSLVPEATNGRSVPALGGGIYLLYPSRTLALLDKGTCQTERVGQSQATIKCEESYSRTQLSLDFSLSETGSLTMTVRALNPNQRERLVEFGVGGVQTPLLAQISGSAQVVVPPGGSYTWQVHIAPLSAVTAAATPQAGKPVALATPVPARLPSPSSLQPSPVVPTATPIAKSVLPAELDPRLAELGITLLRHASATWQLVSACYEDETQSGGMHHIFVTVIGDDSCSAPVWVSWPDGRAALQLRSASAGRCEADFPMYGVLGSYSVGVGDSSDVLQGLGLPGKRHVNYRLTFERRP